MSTRERDRYARITHAKKRRCITVISGSRLIVGEDLVILQIQIHWRRAVDDGDGEARHHRRESHQVARQHHDNRGYYDDREKSLGKSLVRANPISSSSFKGCLPEDQACVSFHRSLRRPRHRELRSRSLLSRGRSAARSRVGHTAIAIGGKQRQRAIGMRLANAPENGDTLQRTLPRRCSATD